MNKLVEFFKLLSDETRLRILILLAHSDLYVCQLSGILDLPQPRVSKHLSKLRELDYVKANKEDKFISYSINLVDKDDEIKVFIEDIVKNINNYPQLNKDKQRLIEKDKFFNQCKTNIKNQGE